MPAPVDPDAKISDYTSPDRLVTTQWVADHADRPDVVLVESDEDVRLYDTGHIPGAVAINWYSDLNDPTIRDYLDTKAFASLVGGLGIGRDTTVVIYGDNDNWWAAYTAWLFTLFGHPDVRLLDGGRNLWVAEGRPLVSEATKPAPVWYPTVPRDDFTYRALRDDVASHIGYGPILDIRSPEEYRGDILHLPDYPLEGALRGGHIPTAVNIPWRTAVRQDGTYKSRDELEQIYGILGVGLGESDDIVTYCRIGERSAHTWFALTFLLGFSRVRNYDGSWAEWGNLVGAPVATGAEPGPVPRRR